MIKHSTEHQAPNLNDYA